jgi:tRNA(Ile)-lysidine synthase
MKKASLLSDSVVNRLCDPAVSRLVVGLSGGVDSVTLLHAVVNTAQDKPVIALHINHQLQSDADRFAESSNAVCQTLGVTCVVIDVEVADGASPEGRAREARYAAFDRFLEPGDLLLLAHHADDQVETILFRLFRGGRGFGLEGMPREREIGDAYLFRPLLDVTRQAIVEYAGDHGLGWTDDPSNAETGPDRNFLRHEVLPLIEARWPSFRRVLLGSLEGDERARELIQFVLAEQVARLRRGPNSLDIESLRTCSEDEIVDLLTAWLMSFDVALPGGRLLREIATTITAQEVVDAGTGNLEFREHDGALYLLKQLPELESIDQKLTQKIEVAGGEIFANEVTEGQRLKPGDDYTVRYRLGGEKLRIRHDRTLKYLFQEHRVPAWLRGRIPLIFRGEKLVAIAGIPQWGVPMLVADGWTPLESSIGLTVNLSLDDTLAHNSRSDSILH